jgi:hypothetical protein
VARSTAVVGFAVFFRRVEDQWISIWITMNVELGEGGQRIVGVYLSGR